MQRSTAALLFTGVLVFASMPLFSSIPTAAAVATPAFVTYTGPGAIGPIEETFGEGTLPVGQPIGSEPSLGINPTTGVLLYQLGEETYRIEFDDAAGTADWVDVTPPTSRFNLDPLLYTDTLTGRVFAGGLDGTCSSLSFSDDDGSTWLPVGNSCTATLDHPSIVSGPWRVGASIPPRQSDRAVYYCGQQGSVTCVLSLDGGQTFVPAAESNTGTVPCGTSGPGLHGSLHIDAVGRVMLPFRDCDGKIGAAYTHNNGLAWSFAQVANSATPDKGFDPDVGSGPTKAYMGYQNADGIPFVAQSSNGGVTWGAGVDVGSAAGIETATLMEMVVGDDDRAALAFIGTKDAGNGFDAAFTGDWYLFVAATYDGGATWDVQQVTPDPVQRGPICADGVGCTSHRNLLDFNDATMDAKGFVHVAYTDGCVGPCAAPSGTPAMSTSAAGGLARQVGGRPLLAAFDPTLDVGAGGDYSGAAGSATAVAASVTGGTAPYTYAWTVVAKPAGSTASSASFASASSASTTFTPDLAGGYQIRVAVTDSASVTTSDIALFAAAGSGPASTAVLTDANGDVVFLVLTGEGVETFVPGTDILDASVLGETASEFTLELRIDGLENARATGVNTLDGPVGPVTIYSLGFLYDERPGNVVSYVVTAVKYGETLDGAPATEFALNTRGQGTTQFSTPIDDIDGIWDAANDRIVWTVPKAIMTVRTAPTGATDPGDVTSGNVPTGGDVIRAFDASVATWVYTPVGGVGPGSTRWDTATGGSSFTFGGGVATLAAEAGGAYTGLAGAAIGMSASATGGSSPYTYAWSIVSKPATSTATAANFASATSAATTFTPDIAGAYVLEITVTDSTSATATDTATLTATTTGGGSGTLVAAGTIIVGGPHTQAASAAEAGVNGLDGFIFDAPAAGTVIRTETTDGGGIGYDLDIYFFGAGGAFISACADGIDPECTVPAGALEVEVAAFIGALLEIEVRTV